MSVAKPSFLRSALLTYGTQLLLLPLSLGAAALQARLIGPAGRGQVSLLVTAVALTSLFLGLGLAGSITFHVASGKVVPRGLVTVLTKYLAGVVLVLALGIALVHRLGGGTALIGSLEPTRAYPVLLALVSLGLVNGWLAATLSARGAFASLNSVSLAVGLVPICIYAAVMTSGPAHAPVEFVFLALVSAEVARLVLLFAAVRVAERGFQPGPTNEPLRSLIAYSGLAFACDIVQFLTYRADVWIIRGFRGDTELGQYSLAVSLAELTLLAAGAFSTVLFPRVPTLARSEAIRTTTRVGALTLVTTAAIAAVGFALAIPLVPRLFTEAFRPSVALLGILLIGVVPMSLAKILGNYFGGTGQLKVNLAAAIVGMVVCLTGDLLTIPRFGATAAAVCTVVAYSVFTAILLIAFVARSGQSLRSLAAGLRVTTGGLQP
ncbi:MAG: polysaccharide biosynthesis C-terminal domain-containing protein [Archangium sp.]|nr:polysaccharide biosynthesis C-terminal domain-containing protein [Archangium sp.]